MPFAGGMYLPTDPECPEVAGWESSFWDDPITAASGCGDEINADWERKHVSKCARCQEYGCANIEVATP